MAGKPNKVVVDGEILVDLTNDTVDPEHLAEGYTAHGRDGQPIVGIMKEGGGSSVNWEDIRNRPFGKLHFSVTWDGTPTGEPVMREDAQLGSLPWYKIADVTPEPDGVRDAYSTVNTAEMGAMQFASEPEMLDGILALFNDIPSLGRLYSSFIAYDGNTDGLAPGLYCIDLSVASMMLGATVTSVASEWVEVKTIDYEYLPVALQFGKRNFHVSWDGSDTGESFDAGLGILLYKVSSETPATDEIKDAFALLQTPVGGVSSPLTPVYAESNGLTAMFEHQYSGGEQPVVILYEGNAFGAAPGIYIADLAAMTEALGAPISGVTLSWTVVKKIDPEYLPDGFGGGGSGVKPSDTITVDPDGTAHVNMESIADYFGEILEEIRNGSY